MMRGALLGGLFGAVALLSPVEALHGMHIVRAGVSARGRSAFVSMSDAPAVAEPDLETSTEESRALRKTHTDKRKRTNVRTEPTVKLEELTIGATVTGVVRNVVSYGAFVDIGAPKDGMLHVSDISNSYVANISDVLSVGDEVTARIKTIDAAAGRFALIMKEESAEPKAREPRPASSGAAAARPSRGQPKKPDLSTLAGFDTKAVIRGKVVSVMDFGCFVSINDNTDGLVHISQLQEARTNAVADVVTVGQEVDVRIIGIDMERQRVSLSMIPWSEEGAAAASSYGERSERPKPSGNERGSPSGATGQPMAPRRDPSQRNGQAAPAPPRMAPRTSPTARTEAPRRQRRERDDMGPAFPSTSSLLGDRAIMDEEEDAPTIFEHAWFSAQATAAAKGVTLPAEMAEK